MEGSKGTSEDIDNADEGGSIPLDSHGSIDFVIPETGTRDIESAISFLHDYAVGNEFEVTIDVCNALENLN